MQPQVANMGPSGKLDGPTGDLGPIKKKDRSVSVGPTWGDVTMGRPRTEDMKMFYLKKLLVV